MATELATAYVTIIPSLKGAGKTVENALGGVNTTATGKRWGNNLSGGLGSGLAKAAGFGVKAVGAIGAAVGGLAIGGGIARAMKIDQAEMKFKALGINVESAMKSCNEAVTGTAFGLDSAATVASMLGASGVKAGNQMTTALKGAAGMAAMGGVELERVGLVYAKVAAQGKLQGDELMQFSEMNVNALGALADYFGVTQAKAREMVKNGEVDFAEFSAAMNKMYGDAAKGANETFSGAMANVMAALSRLGAKFASPALEGLRKVFVALIPAIDAVSAALDPAVKVFTKFVDAVSGRAVAGIEAFTGTLTKTGSFLSAFKASLMATFEGTAIDGFVFWLSDWVSDLAAKMSACKTPAEAFRLALDTIKRTIDTLVSGSGFQSFIDGIKAKIESLPAPVQRVIGVFTSFGQKVKSALSGINIGGAAAAAGFGAILVKFNAPLKTFATNLLKIVPKVKGLFGTIGSYGGIVAMISTKIRTLGSAVTLCGGPFGFLKTAIMGLLTPANLIVGAIAALAAAFIYMMATNEGFRTTVMSVVASIGSSLAPILTTLMQSLSSLATALLPVLSNLIATLAPVLAQIVLVVLQVVAALAPVISMLVSTLVPILTEIIIIVVSVAATLISALMPVITTILGVIQMLLPVIQLVITIVAQVVTSLASALVPVITIIAQVIQQLMPIIAAIIGVVAQVVMQIVALVVPIIMQIAMLIQQVMPTIMGIVTTVMNVIMMVIQTVMPIILSIIQAVWPAIKVIITTVMNVIRSVIMIVMGIINGNWSQVWNGIKSLVSSVWNGIKNFIRTAINAVKSVISSVLNGIKSIWNSVWGSIKSFVSDTWENVKNSVSNGVDSVIDFVSSLPDKIMEFFSDAGSWLVDSGKKIIDGLKEGITNAFDSAKKALEDGLSTLRNLLPFSPAKEGPFSGKGWTLYSGQSIVEGLADGIAKRSKTAQAAMNSVMSGISEAASIQKSDIAPFDDVNTDVRTWRNVKFTDDTANMDEIIGLLSNYLPEMAKEKQLVMDTGVVAGALTPAIDKNLGKKNVRRSKGL